MKYVLLFLLTSHLYASEEIKPSAPRFPPIITRSPEMEFHHHHQSITITIDDKDSPGKKPFCSEKTKKILVSSAAVVVTGSISALITYYSKQCGN